MTVDIESIAKLIADHWRSDSHINELIDHSGELDIDTGYAIQERFTENLATQTCGWKIAATNVAGQKHIQVTHPLAGRLFADRVYETQARLLLRNNRMLVAEGEFAFRIANNINPGGSPLSQQEVMQQVDGLFPAVEIPDSRFVDFVSAGAATLIADNACGREFVLGEEVTGQWRDIAFDRFEVRMIKNGQQVLKGTGADVLGDPREALTWLVNDCLRRNVPLKAGEIVTTGVVGAPVPISQGDEIIADFGMLGRVIVSFG